MTASSPRKILVAGSSGACGRAMLRLASAAAAGSRLGGAQVVPHLRPKARDAAPPPGAIVCDLADEPALAAALASFTTVVQLIGTMRKRFAAGDTYESSDIGTTRQLCAAARRAGSVDHIVLLSSVGAGGMGAYLQAKAAAEALVRDSGIPFTIFRPSAFMGEGHRAIPGAKPLLRALGLRRFEPIAVDDLVAAMLGAALDRAPLGEILEGRSLWAAVEHGKRRLS